MYKEKNKSSIKLLPSALTMQNLQSSPMVSQENEKRFRNFDDGKRLGDDLCHSKSLTPIDSAINANKSRAQINCNPQDIHDVNPSPSKSRNQRDDDRSISRKSTPSRNLRSLSPGTRIGWSGFEEAKCQTIVKILHEGFQRPLWWSVKKRNNCVTIAIKSRKMGEIDLDMAFDVTGKWVVHSKCLAKILSFPESWLSVTHS